MEEEQTDRQDRNSEFGDWRSIKLVNGRIGGRHVTEFGDQNSRTQEQQDGAVHQRPRARPCQGRPFDGNILITPSSGIFSFSSSSFSFSFFFLIFKFEFLLLLIFSTQKIFFFVLWLDSAVLRTGATVSTSSLFLLPGHQHFN